MIRPKCFLCGAGALLWTALLTGCATWQTRDVVPAEYVAGQNPSQIRVERTDGSHRVLYSPRVRGDSLVGSRNSERKRVDRAVALEDIKSVASPDVNPGRTVLFGVGAVAAAVGLYYMAAGNYSWTE